MIIAIPSDPPGGLGIMTDTPRGSFIVAAARGFGHLAEHEGPEAQVIKKADKVLFTGGESDDSFFIDATLFTTDTETAKQIQDVLQGLIALGAMLGDEEPHMEMLNKIIGKIHLERDGKKIELRHAMPSKEVMDLLKGSMEL